MGNYCYEVGYSTCESSGSVMLSHDILYDETTFRNLCLSVSKAAADRYREQNNTDDIRFELLYSIIADLLVEKHGFERVRPKGALWMFGWSNIMDQQDWKEHRCQDMELMRKVILGEIVIDDLYGFGRDENERKQ